MPAGISQEVLEEAVRLLAGHEWDTRKGYIESGAHLHVGVYPLTGGAVSVLFIPFRSNDIFFGMRVRVKVSGEEYETTINGLGEAVFLTLPDGLAEIELVA